MNVPGTDGPRPTTIDNYCCSGSERTAVPSTTMPSSMDPTIFFFLPFFVRTANGVKHYASMCFSTVSCACVCAWYVPSPCGSTKRLRLRINGTKKHPGSFNTMHIIHTFLVGTSAIGVCFLTVPTLYRYAAVGVLAAKSPRRNATQLTGTPYFIRFDGKEDNAIWFQMAL